MTARVINLDKVDDLLPSDVEGSLDIAGDGTFIFYNANGDIRFSGIPKQWRSRDFEFFFAALKSEYNLGREHGRQEKSHQIRAALNF